MQKVNPGLTIFDNVGGGSGGFGGGDDDSEEKSGDGFGVLGWFLPPPICLT